jgi:hypothetical protein
MKTCDKCLHRGGCWLENNARACMSVPHCGYWNKRKEVQLEFDYES